MNDINRDNYQAWFLDHFEGRLSANGLRALEDFLVANPDLRDELDEYEGITLPTPAVPEINWEDLKQPDLAALLSDEQAREELYFNAVEGQLNTAQQAILDNLIATPQYAGEYSLWQKTKLEASNDTMAYDELYRFGLARPVDEDNFDYHLIALSEGLLDADQLSALQHFAEASTKRSQALALASAMRLEAPTGIFFPDKDKLYQKQRGGVLPLWCYRAAAIVLLLGLGAVLWNGLRDANVLKTAPIVINHPVENSEAAVVDSTSVNELSAPKNPLSDAFEKPIGKALPITESTKVAEQQTTTMEENPLPKHPDDETTESDEQHLAQAFESSNTLQPMPKIESVAEISLPSIENPELIARNPSRVIGLDETNLTATEYSDAEFKTIPQWAAQKLSRQLQLAERERDLLALAVAKKVTERAGETISSVYKKEEIEDGNILTYTFRIGGVELSHTRPK